jgi:hypothetical protein
VTHVQGARRASALGLPYLEVRYETLSRRDSAGLREVHQFCGIDVTEQECAGLYERFSFDRMAATAGPGAAPATASPGLLVGGDFATGAEGRVEPEGFYRKGRVAGWRDEWSARERLVFDAVGGDLLVELGYEPDHRWAADPLRSRMYRYQAVASAAVGKSTRWLGRQGERLAQKTPRS